LELIKNIHLFMYLSQCVW